VPTGDGTIPEPGE